MPPNRSTRAWIIPAVSTWAVAKILALGVALLVSRSAGEAPSLTAPWARQEYLWYADIARNGYVGTGEFAYNTAYFPGTSMVMRAGLALGLDPAATGMIAAAIASLAAVLALARLAPRYGSGPGWASIAWLAAPTAVFLVAPWSEALFTAFAFWSWVAAREGRWAVAGLLAGAATYVRVNGLFLAIALVVLLVVSRRASWRSGAWLLLPGVVVAAHFAYLHSITGSWTAWRDAMAEHFNRGFADPVSSLTRTIALVTDYVPGTFSSRFILELAAAAAIALFTVVLLRRRLWAEATYLAVTLASLVTADFYEAVPRTLVVLFPIWLVIGSWLTRSVALRWAYVGLCIPISAVTVLLFTQGQWVG